jgi:hypothetical protein
MGWTPLQNGTKTLNTGAGASGWDGVTGLLATTDLGQSPPALVNENSDWGMDYGNNGDGATGGGEDDGVDGATGGGKVGEINGGREDCGVDGVTGGGKDGEVNGDGANGGGIGDDNNDDGANDEGIDDDNICDGANGGGVDGEVDGDAAAGGGKDGEVDGAAGGAMDGEVDGDGANGGCVDGDNNGDGANGEGVEDGVNGDAAAGDRIWCLGSLPSVAPQPLLPQKKPPARKKRPLSPKNLVAVRPMSKNALKKRRGTHRGGGNAVEDTAGMAQGDATSICVAGDQCECPKGSSSLLMHCQKCAPCSGCRKMGHFVCLQIRYNMLLCSRCFLIVRKRKVDRARAALHRNSVRNVQVCSLPI